MPVMDATLSKESGQRLDAGRMSKTAAYYLAFVALGLASASLGPTLPGLAENTQTHLREISFLFTARSLGYLLGSFSGGRFYDRKPGHPVMGLMLIGMASGSILYVTATGWRVMTVVAILLMITGNIGLKPIRHR